MALVRPVRGQLDRTDMGVDIIVHPGDPVVAIAPSRMIGIIRDWFEGQPYAWFQILSGPFRGKYWYAAEQIDFSAQPGRTYAAGERIGTIARSGTNTEFGWAARSGATLAKATTGYTEGQVTPAGKSFRAALLGATAPGDMAWQPCTLTWYDPALGGTNSSSGRADPHSATSSGEPYSASAFTCAAPEAFPFGTKLTFRYRKRMVTCRVNDRGGAISGTHFDLSRAAANKLGIVNAGKVSAEYSQVGAGAQPPSGPGVTRPGGSQPDSGAGLEALYKSFLDEGKAGDNIFAAYTGTPGGARRMVSDLILPGVGPIPGTGELLQGFDPFNLFKQGADAIQSTQDLLKLIGWMLNPRNVLRVVEFLVGLSLLFVALRVHLRVFGDAAMEKGVKLGRSAKRGAKRVKATRQRAQELKTKSRKRSEQVGQVKRTPGLPKKPQPKLLGSGGAGGKAAKGGKAASGGRVASAASKATKVIKLVPK